MIQFTTPLGMFVKGYELKINHLRSSNILLANELFLKTKIK